MPIIFGISIGLMFVALVSYYFNFKFLKKLDPAVQRLVSRVSYLILKMLEKAEKFLLVHLYRMSADKVRQIIDNASSRKEILLDRLRGNTPKLSKQMVDQSVSPFLREIPKIDRNSR